MRRKKLQMGEERDAVRLPLCNCCVDKISHISARVAHCCMSCDYPVYPEIDALLYV